MSINFGTDGWRAVISDTFTFHNLRIVSQAIADALASETWNDSALVVPPPDTHKVIIGFDTRFLSDRYAMEVARVLAANGYTVLLCQADAPTPAVSYTVRNLNAQGGVVITASHNPPRYNGVKLKAAYGGSASPEQCRRVEVYLNDNESLGRGPNLIDFEKGRQLNLIQRINPIPAYYEHLRRLIDFDTIANAELRIVIDPMYGSGRGVIRGILQGTGVEVREIRDEMNPGFGGAHPEPIMRYLDPLTGAVSSSEGSFGLATDGDADRIGAVDERGSFVSPNVIMALALKHLVEKRGMSGAVVRTVSTTRMVDRLAKKYGLNVLETPVGFNHIADHMLKGDVLIGGEESGGISFKGHIPEGDGILMGLLIIEIVAKNRATLHELAERLSAEVGPAFYERRDIRLARPIDRAQMDRHLTDEAPASIGGEGVTEVRALDGVKYILADDSWLLIRPSGTEPLLRLYAEGRSPKMVKSLLNYGEGIAARVT